MRLQAKQGFMQLSVIIGKVENSLARGSENRGALRGPQRGEVVLGGFPYSRQVAKLQMHVVKKVGYKTFGNGGRACRTRRRRFPWDSIIRIFFGALPCFCG